MKGVSVAGSSTPGHVALMYSLKTSSRGCLECWLVECVRDGYEAAAGAIFVTSSAMAAGGLTPSLDSVARLWLGAQAQYHDVPRCL